MAVVEISAVAPWQVPLRLALDALSEMYYGVDGPWLDELLTASLAELRFQSSTSTQEEVEYFFQEYRRRLRCRG